MVGSRPPLSSLEEEVVCWGPEQQSAVGCGALKRHNLGYDLPIYSLELHRSSCSSDNLRRYYMICMEATDLMVTTSCFAVWKEGKFQNGCAKVIPAVPVKDAGGSKARVFFFDDNINLHLGTSAGSSDAKGICNLRCVSKGEYIDFSDGKNGFTRETAFRHTLIHHSSEYQNVMVQVNILDAMSNPHYFTDIIKRYAKVGEKLIVYMDVNGTILWDDTIMNLGQEEVLLSTMLGCIEVRASGCQDFVWDSQRTVRLELGKPKSLKQLVHDLSGGDQEFYRTFWNPKNCSRLLEELLPVGEIRWTSGETPEKPPLSPQGFADLYRSYMEEMESQNVAQGMTASWFRCLDMLREGGHAAVIQSFGMDTHRVVRRSVTDERKVLHIAVNVELWSERDRRMFAEQFQPADPAADSQRPSQVKNAMILLAQSDDSDSFWARWRNAWNWGCCRSG
mmetsp:Transcript_1171/g.2554  ORF Transcript_1171/g.2554 Transcript_1171/m.2554 type:complete len:449 (-) Transcript_1171:19-1365(-)